MSVPIDTRVFTIQERIADLHGGGINNISVSFHRHRPDAPAPVASTLMDLGIVQEGEINVFYDFEPVSHPLLS